MTQMRQLQVNCIRGNMERYVLYVLSVVVCVQSLQTGAGRTVVQVSPMTWWDAQNNCRREYQSNLLVSETRPADVNLETGEYYWLGARVYMAWRWTRDETNLYKYVGYTTFGTLSQVQPITVDDISVYQCNFHCTNHHLIGLSGNKCYCVDKDIQISVEEPSVEVQTCEGNLEEKCGNSLGMSVYKLDGFVFNPTRGFPCTFVTKDSAGSLTMGSNVSCSTQLHVACFQDGTPEECSDGKAQNCSGNVCVSCRSRSWVLGNSTCSMLKVDGSSRQDLLNVMSESSQLWVGVYRHNTEAWIDGTRTFSKNPLPTDEIPWPVCLALHVSPRDGDVLEWRHCGRNYSSICGQEGSTSSARPMYSKTSFGVTATLGLHIGAGILLFLLTRPRSIVDL